jgi:hypothetical protein
MRVPDLKLEAAVMLVVCLLLVFQSTAVAEEQRVHAQVGSYWNYLTTDEIKGTKSILETILTEVNGDERVIRTNLPDQNAMVCDKNWNLIQSGAYKFHPNNGQGVPVPLQIGSKSQVNVTFNVQSAAGWSKLRPHSVEAEIVSAETISTKAGQFETYRVEITSKFRGSPTTPLSVNELMTGWFSPKVDHFVRTQIETRTDGHLITKNSSELIEYEMK